MNRSRRGNPVDGLILLDKSAGWSSNRALQEVKKLLGARKAGHTGTLDPFATGMLPICLGESTKTATYMIDSVKCYRATACLGIATATGDREGDVIRNEAVPELTIHELKEALNHYVGEIEQVPPMYSALKRAGRPLYEYARAGVTVERRPRRVRIHEIELREWNSPCLSFELCCSKGTYVRTLAEDVAARLGTCAHLTALRRMWVEPFRTEEMRSLEDLRTAAKDGKEKELLLPLDAGLRHWPEVRIAGEAARRFRNGSPVAGPEHAVGRVRVYAQDGLPLGIGEVEEDRLHPRRVFVHHAGSEGPCRVAND